MNFGKYLLLARKERLQGRIKAKRTHYSVNYNPSTIQSGQMLIINNQNTIISSKCIDSSGFYETSI